MNAPSAAEPQPTRLLAVCLLIAAALISGQASILYLTGQPPFCACGTIRLWIGSVSSAETSQQLTDWYTFSHLLHGVMFYGLLHLIARRVPLPVRFVIAVGLEAGWELLENTPLVIERYRQSALAQGYFGDSVLNSVSDTLAAAAGFAAASILPTRLTIVLVIVIELTVGYLIRDNLTLNIIQLLHPSQWISQWQSAR